MAARSSAKRIVALLEQLESATTPTARLEAARKLGQAARELEQAQIDAARKDGATWADVGNAYGITKQGAQQRFGGGYVPVARRGRPAKKKK